MSYQKVSGLLMSIVLLALSVALHADVEHADLEKEEPIDADAADDVTEAAAARNPGVDEILNREPELSDYVEENRCINRQRIREFEVIDDKHVAIEMNGQEYYLVRFKHRCPGLRRGSAVMYEGRLGGSLCRHDTIRTLYNEGPGRKRPGIPCQIPGFQSVTKEQLLHLKDALKAEKRRKRNKTG